MFVFWFPCTAEQSSRSRSLKQHMENATFGRYAGCVSEEGGTTLYRALKNQAPFCEVPTFTITVSGVRMACRTTLLHTSAT